VDCMTKVAGVPSRDDAKPGMAFFAATGPPEKNCGGCKHRTDRTSRCQKFTELAGKDGPPVRGDYRACKYFVSRTPF
jgi:hypothetical protein